MDSPGSLGGRGGFQCFYLYDLIRWQAGPPGEPQAPLHDVIALPPCHLPPAAAPGSRAPAGDLICASAGQDLLSELAALATSLLAPSICLANQFRKRGRLELGSRQKDFSEQQQLGNTRSAAITSSPRPQASVQMEQQSPAPFE